MPNGTKNAGSTLCNLDVRLTTPVGHKPSSAVSSLTCLDDVDRLFRKPLRGFFLRRSVPASDADDLTQDVFLRLLGRQRQTVIENLQGYMFRVATNVLFDFRRGSAACAEISLDDRPSGDSEWLVDWIDAERIALGREALERVRIALEGLDERSRTVILLYRLERLRQRDIAAQIGMSVSSVEKIIVKATVHLAKALRQ